MVGDKWDGDARWVKPNLQGAALVLVVRRCPDALERLERLATGEGDLCRAAFRYLDSRDGHLRFAPRKGCGGTIFAPSSLTICILPPATQGHFGSYKGYCGVKLSIPKRLVLEYGLRFGEEPFS